MQRRWLLFAVILTAPYGCDNVTWGGVHTRLQAPPSQAEAAPDTTPEVKATETLIGVPVGPILLAGTREGDLVTLVAVGEVLDDGLSPFPSETQTPGFLKSLSLSRLSPGTELILFSDGARVGRVTITETSTDTRFCVPRASVTGVVELTPGAAAARRVLALLDTAAASRPFAPYRSRTHDYDQRVASLSLAAEAIPLVGAAWPPSLLDSRVDIQAFRLPDAGGNSVVATFLFNDRLAVAQPGNGAYALFVMGSQGSNGYQADFVWYRPTDSEGKGAPRYFDHLDWNRDGRSEILLDVFGAEHRWFASMGQRNGTWVRTFQDSCGTPTG